MGDLNDVALAPYEKFKVFGFGREVMVCKLPET